MIIIPSQYQEMESKHVKVIALLVDTEVNEQAAVTHEEKPAFADGYIDQHWRELIITASTDPLQDDDAVLKEEFGGVAAHAEAPWPSAKPRARYQLDERHERLVRRRSSGSDIQHPGP